MVAVPPASGMWVGLLQQVLGEEGGPLLRHLHRQLFGGVEGVLLAVVKDDNLLKGHDKDEGFLSLMANQANVP